jgi:hypothetical protein
MRLTPEAFKDAIGARAHVNATPRERATALAREINAMLQLDGWRFVALPEYRGRQLGWTIIVAPLPAAKR